MAGLKCAAFFCLVLQSIGLSAVSATAGELRHIADFGPNPGNLEMHLYVPDGLGPDRPLVVALHGCWQNGPEYVAKSGWAALADKHRFMVLLPEQQLGILDNNARYCFNWHRDEDMRRDSGEPASVVAMVDYVRRKHRVDDRSIYVTGHSGGGGMAAVLMADYPERFAAGAIIAGLPFRCTDNGAEWLRCQRGDIDRTPEDWGARVRQAAATYNGPYPRVSIWHGSKDGAVNPKNAQELVEQWANVHGLEGVPDVSDRIKGHDHAAYLDADGRTVLEIYMIEGLDHAVPVDPSSAPDGCGSVGEFYAQSGICASYYIAKFFGVLG